MLQLDIVSAEAALFSGLVSHAHFPGQLGEFEVLPGHVPFLTLLKPGNIVFVDAKGEEDALYVSGGFVEVQGSHVHVLADVAVRADELDEVLIADSMHAEREKMATADVDYSAALTQLNAFSAQIHLLQRIRKIRK